MKNVCRWPGHDILMAVMAMTYFINTQITLASMWVISIVSIYMFDVFFVQYIMIIILYSWLNLVLRR